MRIVCGSWCKLAHRYIARIAKWLDFPDIIPIPPSPISRLIFPPPPWDFARMKRRVSFNFCPSRETQIHTLTIKKYYKFTCFFNNNNEIDRFLLINRRMFVYLVQRRKSRLFLPNYDQKNRRERNEAKKQRFLHPGCTFLPSSSPDNSIEKTLRFDRSNLHPRATKTGSRSR